MSTSTSAVISFTVAFVHQHAGFHLDAMHCSDGLFYVLPLMPQIMCSQFWPNEELHSVEYGQLVVTFVSTTPKSDWEMTILQVSDRNRVSLVELFHFRKIDCQDLITLKWHDHSPPFPELWPLPKCDPVSLPLLAKRGPSSN